MNRSSRVARPLYLLVSVAILAATPQVAPARPGDHPNKVNVVSALPPLPPQDDPWLYQGSDIPHDKEWSFGTLSNGLRWAVRANSVPPGQVSIRIRMDVGSLYEKPEEAGFAHLIEHLVFRQSKYLGQNEAIPPGNALARHWAATPMPRRPRRRRCSRSTCPMPRPRRWMKASSCFRA
jgi:zinc protease